MRRVDSGRPPPPLELLPPLGDWGTEALLRSAWCSPRPEPYVAGGPGSGLRHRQRRHASARCPAGARARPCARVPPDLPRRGRGCGRRRRAALAARMAARPIRRPHAPSAPPRTPAHSRPAARLVRVRVRARARARARVRVRVRQRAWAELERLSLPPHAAGDGLWLAEHVATTNDIECVGLVALPHQGGPRGERLERGLVRVRVRVRVTTTTSTYYYY